MAQPIRLALFTLAEKLGYADPDAMGETIPAALLAEWGVYWKVRAKLEKAAVESASQK